MNVFRENDRKLGNRPADGISLERISVEASSKER